MQDEVLKNIASDIRKVLPPDAILPSESICMPTVGESAMLDPRHTAHVDGFLYDDELVDELCDAGKMSRNYCTDCGSHRTKPISFISHSASRGRLLYIFTALLGPLNEKTILDVGSRLGAILYGAYLYSTASKIFGIELNKDLCDLQKGIVQKYGFQDRIQVLERNLVDSSELVQLADVVILNNVFEFFMPHEAQVHMWRFLRNTIKSGTLLVTIPPLEESLQHMKARFAMNLDTGINLEEWVRESPPFNADAPGIENLQSEIDEVKLYVVL
ncbi:hypothetical protein J437_LFUL003042 [Ladona fulva]|uniref:Methyltransferase type 11 domain-containing protein n=1 Tax=Ladona fulva TaxID=123851 RepID=A0A8K0NVR7_LADFU|nr:hypothetical protein J437_LFUL003042 [Ladona fulva]